MPRRLSSGGEAGGDAGGDAKRDAGGDVGRDSGGDTGGDMEETAGTSKPNVFASTVSPEK